MLAFSLSKSESPRTGRYVAQSAWVVPFSKKGLRNFLKSFAKVFNVCYHRDIIRIPHKKYQGGV